MLTEDPSPRSVENLTTLRAPEDLWIEEVQCLPISDRDHWHIQSVDFLPARKSLLIAPTNSDARVTSSPLHPASRQRFER